MKIFVDQMPVTPQECPYYDYNGDPKTSYCCYGIRTRHICEDTSECPYFRELNINQLAKLVDEELTKNTESDIDDIISQLKAGI